MRRLTARAACLVRVLGAWVARDVTGAVACGQGHTRKQLANSDNNCKVAQLMKSVVMQSIHVAGNELRHEPVSLPL